MALKFDSLHGHIQYACSEEEVIDNGYIDTIRAEITVEYNRNNVYVTMESRRYTDDYVLTEEKESNEYLTIVDVVGKNNLYKYIFEELDKVTKFSKEELANFISENITVNALKTNSFEYGFRITGHKLKNSVYK